MYNAKVVLPILIVFLGLLTYPLWSPKASAPPQLAKPLMGEKCIESNDWMRANHMQLLEDWRHSVVRDQNRDHVAQDGQHYDKSLSNGCLSCHQKEQFCDSCHNYASVHPYCWDCHFDPKEVSDVH